MAEFDLTFRPVRRRACRVRLGRGVLRRLIDEITEISPAPHVVIIADEVVMPLHGAPLAQRLRERDLAVDELSFPTGERLKTRDTKAALEDRLLQLGIGRDGLLIAVGGGVTGDLVGFLAATWMRGIPVIQVPTSLLSMVDASLGGKTAVDLPGAKNQIGAFHQPTAVYADLDLLSSLSQELFVDGLAEVVKSAVIADLPLFRTLEQGFEGVLAREPLLLERIIADCMRIKGRVVSGDERETGRRAMLNFGHTLGHALEVVSGFEVSHGQAVSFGMCVEARLAVEVAGFKPAHLRRMEAVLLNLGLPTGSPRPFVTEQLLAATLRDKKARNRRSRYALPVALGRMPTGSEVTREVDPALVRRTLDRLVEETAPN